jgi:hypothetical protein
MNTQARFWSSSVGSAGLVSIAIDDRTEIHRWTPWSVLGVALRNPEIGSARRVRVRAVGTEVEAAAVFRERRPPVGEG